VTEKKKIAQATYRFTEKKREKGLPLFAGSSSCIVFNRTRYRATVGNIFRKRQSENQNLMVWKRKVVMLAVRSKAPSQPRQQARNHVRVVSERAR
jgi:hypothetical protein